MGISDGGGVGLAAIAWMVAGALALAFASVFFGLKAYRRSREAEARLLRLESAVGEFCEALRERVGVARERAEDAFEEDEPGDAPGPREALGVGTARQ